ncbi:class III extradiol ring-cleavage dioxygenase [Bradyrhizobium sp. CB1650]|uniref:DODA-type extradiol aromatic ring-opening family dioxygenase n=1 Tax=Bradyrhizobium sp. CB1650 TaxID=3039153 RepID=UPI002435391A|nr:class III extradiol ring-cleavage dioxygenase [Bradyrhizobium sp. CB1650]WGD54602.1 class III extradiol ring-cleavage dioxygenase [Bradyrhizobium sp. CB1650]
MTRFPTFFLSHGGGPWPFMEDRRAQYAKTAELFSRLPLLLPAKPKAVLVITGHWEADAFTVSTSAHPPMVYDYYGFPEHTYHLKYPAPGQPELAGEVKTLLALAGVDCREDANQGFDHGTFVPLGLMYPNADMPIVLLSLKSGYDAAEHVRVGQAIAPLREAGILIIGSGLTYHNMRGFGRPESTPVSYEFEAYLNEAVGQPDAARRNAMLVGWQNAPSARLAHPREDHLLPLMVAAGAAGRDVGQRLFLDEVASVAMASYVFGGRIS